MLDFIRSHRRLMMIILALFVVPGLGLVGIQGFRGMWDDSANAAKVNGDIITRQQFDAAVRDQNQRAQQMLGASYDASTFDTPAMRRSILDNMIRQQLVAQNTRDLNLTASDNAVRQSIMSIPAIASLKRPDGSFDQQAYAQLLAAQGLSGPQLDEMQRFQLASQQIAQNIVNTAFIPAALAQSLNAMITQQRDVRGLVLRAADYRAQAQPSEADIKAYYDAHHADFTTPEQARIEYVVLSAQALSAASVPSDADIQKYYQANLKQYQSEGQVRASHILIAVPKDASADVRAKAKAHALEVLKEVKAHPDRFAAIAKKESEDPGSADKGGDLGFFDHSMMVKPFADAAFALQKGQISDLVQSDFGYHIIEVTDTKPTVTRPLADVRDAIVRTLQAQAGTDKYAADTEGFSNAVYEQADSLKPAADKYGLAIKTATVTRRPAPNANAADPANNPKLLAAVFSDDALKSKHNTAAIDLGNNTMVSARVTSYQAAALQPFDQVREAARNKVVDEQASLLARKDGAAKLEALRKSPNSVSTAGFSPVTSVTRSNPQGLSQPVLSEVFKADASKLPVFVGVDVPDGGYAIYEITKVSSGAAADPAQVTQIEAQLSQMEGQAENDAYLTALRKRASVKIYDLSGDISQQQDGGSGN
ncbi:peptidylprolyl isomerase [Robbsia andropogonis]|uniref:Periplasmic chaperone PpiD n=1 Tax=Robbsia andropogonis TaxID=28092 RepID=A0A0F5JZ96_9BURK|nr:SurA N-terminal domain-containing protein [Robbsia andropogonis]KKB63143.1 peptidylprolyl isomerase [Robbsia andropogonis]MCP1117529.1 SurA N-terminal domain-containing protein [Robbsia andropogonis]MCP1126995.1 SurA N-terminal domain-containing protein [Robbsia andropogonis]